MFLDFRIKSRFRDFCRVSGLYGSIFAGKHKTYQDRTRFLKAFIRAFNNLYRSMRVWTAKYYGKYIPVSKGDNKGDKKAMEAAIAAAELVLDDFWEVLHDLSKMKEFRKLGDLRETLSVLRQLVEHEKRVFVYSEGKEERDIMAEIKEKSLALFDDKALASFISKRLEEKGYILSRDGTVYAISWFMNNALAIRGEDENHATQMRKYVFEKLSQCLRDHGSGHDVFLSHCGFEIYNNDLFGVEDGRHRHLVFLTREKKKHDQVLGGECVVVCVYIYYYVTAGEHDLVFRLNKDAKARSGYWYGHITSCHHWHVSEEKIVHKAHDGAGGIESELSQYHAI